MEDSVKPRIKQIPDDGFFGPRYTCSTPDDLGIFVPSGYTPKEAYRVWQQKRMFAGLQWSQAEREKIELRATAWKTGKTA